MIRFCLGKKYLDFVPSQILFEIMQYYIGGGDSTNNLLVLFLGILMEHCFIPSYLNVEKAL